MSIRIPIWLCAMTLCVLGLDAAAQGPRGPQLPPEKLDAAWTLEAANVSESIGLSAADTAKVVTAYKASRESHGKVMEEMMATAERGPQMFQQMQDIATAERAKLATDLEGAIGKENAGKAVAVLGTYNRGWDRFVDTLAAFGLEAAKLSQGLTKIAEHVVEVDKAQQEAFASFDREGLRAASDELKAKLDDAMGAILSPEQLATWKENTVRRGRGGPGGPPPQN
jgi:hypothetical protein